MSLVTATAAQRIALRNTATNLSEQTQVYAQSATVPTAAEAAIVQPYIDAAKIAIDAVNGTSGATVANGATVAVVNSASADSHNATATVTGTTLTNVKLAATVAFVDNGDALTGVAPTGTYTNAVTFTVAGGVITGIVLS